MNSLKLVSWLRKLRHKGPEVTVKELGGEGSRKVEQSLCTSVVITELQDTRSSGRNQCTLRSRDEGINPSIKPAKRSPVEIRKGIVSAASVQEVRERLDPTFGRWDASKIRTEKLDARGLGTIPAVRKMKHGHQAKWYRESVRKNVKPEEEE